MKNHYGLPARQHALSTPRRAATRPIPHYDDDDDDGDDGAGGPNDLSARDAADYIETVSLQLEEMALASDLTFLSYLLRLVAEEAKLATGPGDQ